jgi:hypothetical protein
MLQIEKRPFRATGSGLFVSAPPRDILAAPHTIFGPSLSARMISRITPR